ncbi:MAG: IS3 family transposase [Candidatus Marinimicrobia bacterium]|nr:IS3 family transposase [Candidatus Neomarinimicrobiota bacterium]
MTESFFRTMKSEVIYRFILTTRQVARLIIFEFIEINYNRFRKYSTLGYMSTVDYLNNYMKNSRKAA